MAATDTTGADQARQQVELAVGGMTCASCAMRIEKRLNRLDGVTATVNYATEKAKVDFPADVDPAELVAAVEAAGYTAALPTPRSDGAGVQAVEEADPTRRLRDRLIISALLTVPVLAMAMIPALQFDSWQWLSLTWRPRSWCGGRCRSTGRRGRTCATAPPPWTP